MNKKDLQLNPETGVSEGNIRDLVELIVKNVLTPEERALYYKNAFRHRLIWRKQGNKNVDEI